MTGQQFGDDSRCFDHSNLKKKGTADTNTEQVIRCYVSNCNDSGSQINITIEGTINVICENPDQLLTVPGYDGIIKCPSSFEDFCGV